MKKYIFIVALATLTAALIKQYYDKTHPAPASVAVKEDAAVIDTIPCFDDDETLAWVDLGLPSGTLWCDRDYEGAYLDYEALKNFGDNLPSMEQWKELFDYCSFGCDEASGTLYAVGSNGNKLLFPPDLMMDVAYGGFGAWDDGYWSYWTRTVKEDAPNGCPSVASFSKQEKSLWESHSLAFFSVRLVKQGVTNASPLETHE